MSSSQMTMSSSIFISAERRLFRFGVFCFRKRPKSFLGFGTLKFDKSDARDFIDEIESFSESSSVPVSEKIIS